MSAQAVETAEVDTPQSMYHEPQRFMRCAVHSLNNLLGRAEFTKEQLDEIAVTLGGVCPPSSSATRSGWKQCTSFSTARCRLARVSSAVSMSSQSTGVSAQTSNSASLTGSRYLAAQQATGDESLHTHTPRRI